MNNLFKAIAAIPFTANLAFAAPVIAQPAERAPFTMEQRATIRAHILQEARPSVSVPLELFPAVGTEVPNNVEVFWMPPGAGLNRYRYAILNHRALVLDYEDRRVIEIMDGAP